MNQLGQLKKNADKFKSLNAEVICVFREESKGLEGLKIIKEKTGVDFTLALDNNKEKTGRYSGARGEFTNYVIDSKGVVRAVIEGNLKNRATAEELLSAIEKSSKETSSKASGSGNKTKAGSANRNGG